MNLKDIEKHLNNDLNDIKIPLGIMQRGIGDILELSILNSIKKLYPNVLGASSKRSIEDFQINESDDITKFDVKSHDIDSEFSMPNLISVKRLNKYYQDNKNHLVYVFVKYTKSDNSIHITNITVFHIHQLDWKCLHIQNLGKGQLQIKNSHHIIIKDNNRDEWYMMLKDNIKKFYTCLIESIKKEISLL